MSKFVRKGIVGKSLLEKNGGDEKLTNEKESVFHLPLPEKKVSFIYHYRKRIGVFKNGYPHSFPVMIFDFKNFPTNFIFLSFIVNYPLLINIMLWVIIVLILD